MKRFSYAMFFILAIISLPLNANADQYPDRPITIVLPFPAGTATDGILRTLAQQMSARLGVPVVVENRGGANGELELPLPTRMMVA